MPFATRLLAATAAGLILTSAAAVSADAAAVPGDVASVSADAAAVPGDVAPVSADAAARSARTSAAEARRVDRVRTPKLHWYGCYAAWSQCATAEVPVDYDRPYGRKTEIALVRVKATDQKHKIGTLFVNPGGPGAPATTFALLAPLFLDDSLLARFDIVGMDPRGVGFSDAVQCFGSAYQQTVAMKGMRPVFPFGRTQEKAYVASAKKLGQACSHSDLAGSMSTAEVARDMDVMRRAVGDKKLNYLGFSYGSVLGQYYANMFPDRFRTIAVDGVINPKAWAGKNAQGTVLDDRLLSADGAYKALTEIMRLCAGNGPKRCAFAGGNTMKKFATVANRLNRKPLRITLPLLGTVTETYADFIGDTLSALYLPTAGDDVTQLAADLYELTTPGAKLTAAALAPARTGFAAARARRGFPYDNTVDAYASVMCTDGRHPADAASWPAAAARADRRAPYFGRAWAWASVPCARNTWTAHDEDAYTGPFNRRTQNPVLVVGSWWDPATNYRDAVAAARMLPNSRLLSSNNWGHTAYGTSRCASVAIDRYLLTKHLPARGTVCRGADQPFRQPAAPSLLSSASAVPELSLSPAAVSAAVAAGLPPAGTAKQLPPVGRSFLAG